MKIATDRYATEICPERWKDRDTSEPMFSEWLFADRVASRTFWMTTDRPNVTSSVVNGPRARLAWISVRCTA